MVINKIEPFIGQHCETTATGSLLKQLGFEFSEPLLFGLGEGLGYIFWNMKIMDFPFIGGRIKPDLLSENIVKNLNLKLEVKETTSITRAWDNVKIYIDEGMPVGLKLDCYHLDYFKNKIHFAGHYVAMYGYDDNFAYLIDTQPQGTRVKTSLKSIQLARNEKGPMASHNLSYTIQKTNQTYDLKQIIPIAIKNNAKEHLNPPIQNIGYKGILKTSREIKKWFQNSKDVKRDFSTTAMLMEKAGTGGALFRNLYRDFLKESAELLDSDTLNKAYLQFREIATLWIEVSILFEKAGISSDKKYIDKASEILIELSDKEKRAMQLLLSI